MVGHAPAWAASWAARPLTCAGSVQAFPRRQSIEGEFRDLIERWPWATCRLTSDFSVPDEPRQQGHSRSADESPKARWHGGMRQLLDGEQILIGANAVPPSWLAMMSPVFAR
jgi:hypothetical protein